MTTFNNVVLASASPRRQELLKFLFSDFTICVSNVDEAVPPSVSLKNIPVYLATLKAKDVAQKFPESLVIGADTCVVIDDKVLGKPHSKAEANEMLTLLSGKTHKVITGCYVLYGDKSASFSVETEVEFYSLTEEQIEAYINTDEPYDKAGGYGIQAKGGLFVKKINGDYNNVVGFPIAELNRKIIENFNN